MSSAPSGGIILVTGGTRGAGRVIACHLASSGARVVLQHAGDRDEAQKTLAEMVAEGLSVELVEASVTEEDAVRGMVCAVLKRHGRLDVLVNAISLNTRGNPTEREWRQAFDLTVHGVRLCSAQAAAAMIAQGRGVIVNVSTLDGECAPTSLGVTSAALEALTHHLAAEYATTGIRVNTVTAVNMATAASDALVGLARLVGFLAGDDAASISGQVMRADGALVSGTVTAPYTETEVAALSGRAHDDAVVVVGMGLTVPGVNSPEELWKLLCGDRPVFGKPGERLDLATMWSADPTAEDRTYSRVAGFMTGFEPHPRLHDDITNGTFAANEYTVVWLRHALLQATADVRRRPGDRHLFAVGLTPDGSQHLEQSLVVAAAGALLAGRGTQIPDALAALYPLASAALEDLLPYKIARMAAADLPASSEIVVVDTACSSSLYTIDLGARALRAGEVDVALCGGAYALSVQNMVLFSKLQGLSRSGDVRALDRGADGVLFSDGAAVVVLKKYARAVADGDSILGFIAGFGASSDGRGKAIYAPNAVGQQIALRRAWAAAAVEPGDIEWVIAHATGTPTGDRTELLALAETAGPGKTWTVTSNKSLVGHTGWAAGTVSTIHGLLALRHGVIPAQRRFVTLPDGVGNAVRVPTHDVAWPADQDRPRMVGISAMGFGGTNGHLILTDRLPMPPTKPAVQPDDSIVIVQWGAHLPDDPDADRLSRWLTGGNPDWPAGFGDAYPLPSPVEARLTPSTLAAMDRSQLMALRCADLIGDWAKDADLCARSGVFVGHTGPTRSAIGHGLRCYLSDLTAKLTKPLGLDPRVLKDPVQAMVPPANEDSYPGLMPNIIAARIAQRLDLHGPNMTLDAGLDSISSALSTASRYLLGGDLDLAIIMGVNATTEYVQGRDDREPAEAAIGFVVTRLSVAQSRGMPVLARIRVLRGGESIAGAVAGGVPGKRTYRGAEGAVALLHALHNPAERVVIGSAEDGHTPAVLVVNNAPAARARSLSEVLARHALVLRPAQAQEVRVPVASVPPNSLVVTDAPEALASVKLAPGCLIVAPGPAPQPAIPGIPVVYLDDAGTLAEVVAGAGKRFGQIRVIVAGPQVGAAEPAATRDVLALNDLAFVAAQCCREALDDGGCYAALLLDSFDGAVPRPHVGVFAGVVRSLEQELPGCLTFALVTDARHVGLALEELAEESASHRFIPVAYRRGGRRLELMLLPVKAASPTAALGVCDDPVIVATGGARGLTAHLVNEVIEGRTPRGVWLLGTGPALEETDGAKPLLPRADALRELMAQHPTESIGALSRRYDRSLHEAERMATLRRLVERCGPSRVRYRQCDVRDESAVRRVIGEVLATDGRVDVLLHGAGLVRTSVLARKRLADFRAVRDVKVLGYANLRAALVDHPPGLWCSISSTTAFMGRRGEPDYGAANEFLLLAAAHERAIGGRDEVALVSGLWVESGMGSADTMGGAFLARLGDFGQMTDEQGCEFFRTELRGRGSHGLATTWIGDPDWATLQRKAPGYRPACLASAAAGPEPTRFVPRPDKRAFLTEPPKRRTTDAATWLVEVDLERHSYLVDHLVDDRPTMPGAIILELAAEAAAELAPDLVPTRITDVVLSLFIRAPRHRWPRLLRVVAERSGDEVQVRVTSPATGPVPEREHTRMVVHLARSLPPRPWHDSASVGGDGVEAPNAYELPGAPVQLGGVFTSLRRPRLEPGGGSAGLQLTLPPNGAPFSRFILPSITLDCLLRTAVLDGRRPDEIGIMVPTALARIDLYTTANDLELADAWADGIILRHRYGDSSPRDHCAAIAPDGRALIQITGITGITKRVYNIRTGMWMPGAPRWDSDESDPRVG